MIPDDLRHFDADAFNLISSDAAGQIIFWLVLLFIFVEPIFR